MGSFYPDYEPDLDPDPIPDLYLTLTPPSCPPEDAVPPLLPPGCRLCLPNTKGENNNKMAPIQGCKKKDFSYCTNLCRQKCL